MDMECGKNYVNLIYFLVDLCKLVIFRKNHEDIDRISNLLSSHDPIATYSFLGEIDENFNKKYYQIFAEAFETFVTNCRYGKRKYQKFSRVSKEFVLEYFRDRPALNEEIAKKRFGLDFEGIKLPMLQDTELRTVLESGSQVFLFVEEGIKIIPKKKKLFKRRRSRKNREKFVAIKSRGITVETKFHRIKNNKKKIHYTYLNNEIDKNVEMFVKAIIDHTIPESQMECKTFKIYVKDGEVKINPGQTFLKKKTLNVL